MTIEKKPFQCPKCSGTSYESDRFQATGGIFTRLFDIQNKRFITISCSTCGFTELYKRKTSTGHNILDFLAS